MIAIALKEIGKTKTQRRTRRHFGQRVRDTASFILAAKEIHGDRYDYTHSVFTKWNAPVSIRCKHCGEFVVEKAGTHCWKSYACKRTPCQCDDRVWIRWSMSAMTMRTRRDYNRRRFSDPWSEWARIKNIGNARHGRKKEISEKTTDNWVEWSVSQNWFFRTKGEAWSKKINNWVSALNRRNTEQHEKRY